jgi:hypothetical protein
MVIGCVIVTNCSGSAVAGDRAFGVWLKPVERAAKLL